MINNNRDYRETKPLEPKDDYIIEGYCALFKPYLLMERDGLEYFEFIHPQALNGADMSDIVLQLDHIGKVYARTSNKSLQVTADSKGIFIRADLSKTESARQIYEEVSTGMLNKQSWAFTVEEEYYDSNTRTRNITKIKKIYDCAITAKPANPSTNLKAVERSSAQFLNGVIQKTQTELNERLKVEYLYLLKLQQTKGN